MNLDFDDPQKLKKYLLVAGVLLVVATALWVIFISDREETKKVEQNIKIAEQYGEAPASEDLSVDYSEETDAYLVTFPGYKVIDEVELQMIPWYKRNTDLERITIVYGEIGAERREYDLTKDLNEILQNNPLMNAPDSEPIIF